MNTMSSSRRSVVDPASLLEWRMCKDQDFEERVFTHATPSPFCGFRLQNWRKALRFSALRDYPIAMSQIAKHHEAPAEWVRRLETSKAQIAAEETLPILPVLERLRATAERLEAQQAISPDGDKLTS